MSDLRSYVQEMVEAGADKQAVLDFLSDDEALNEVHYGSEQEVEDLINEIEFN